MRDNHILPYCHFEIKKISKETDLVTRTSLYNDYKKLRNEI